MDWLASSRPDQGMLYNNCGPINNLYFFKQTNSKSGEENSLFRDLKTKQNQPNTTTTKPQKTPAVEIRWISSSCLPSALKIFSMHLLHVCIPLSTTNAYLQGLFLLASVCGVPDFSPATCPTWEFSWLFNSLIGREKWTQLRPLDCIRYLSHICVLVWWHVWQITSLSLSFLFAM